MSYTRQTDGLYHVPIVDLGTRLQNNFGLKIVEHPEFGGVTDVHAPNSYHKYGEALDIQDWRGGDGEGAEGFDGVGYVQRTKNLRNLLSGAGAEVIGPGDMAGHDTHLHLAAKDGVFKLNDTQYNYLFGGNSGGQLSTFAYTDTPTGGQTRTVVTAPLTDDEGNQAPAAVIEAKQRAKTYSEMSKAEMNAEYDRLRKDSPETAAEEGLKMHQAFFGK